MEGQPFNIYRSHIRHFVKQDVVDPLSGQDWQELARAPVGRNQQWRYLTYGFSRNQGVECSLMRERTEKIKMGNLGALARRSE